MLKNIKNNFFIRHWFSFLCELKKFKLAKYNKNLQNILDINLEDYKDFCDGRIIYYEEPKEENNINCSGPLNNQLGDYKKKRKRKGKEDYSNWCFEGEYINGERNGKGKEYFKYFETPFHSEPRTVKILIFEGEYLNNKKWNGIGYLFNGEIAYELKNGKGFIKKFCGDFFEGFEGEYLNGERNGKGKETEGCVIFEGEYLNGKKWNGKGYIQNDKEKNALYELKEGKGYFKEAIQKAMIGTIIIIFEGEYLNGEKNGKGKEYNENGRLKFEGNYKSGKRNGKGKEYDDNGKLIFEGEYFNGKKKGKGKEYYYNGKLKFEGEYLRNKKWNGKGTEYYDKDKIEFEGEYFNGKRWNGKGYDENGNFSYELINGNGKIKEKSTFGFLNFIRGTFEFEGEYLNGDKIGKGKRYDNQGTLVFEGEYLNGLEHGKFKEYYDDGKLKVEGEYLYGKKNGKFKQYFNNGLLAFDGIYLNDIENGKWKEYNSDGSLAFDGEYLNGLKWNGKGKDYNDKDKIEFEGEFLNGKRWNGKFHQNELHCYTYEGEYINGEKRIYTKKIGDQIIESYIKTEKKDFKLTEKKEYCNEFFKFDGQFLNGKRWNGTDKEYHDNGKLIFEGEYSKGERYGKGKEYDSKGRLVFEGEYLNGERWNGTGKEYGLFSYTKLKYLNGERK